MWYRKRKMVDLNPFKLHCLKCNKSDISEGWEEQNKDSQYG